MVDMHEHPAIGIVIARLEDRDDDVERLMGIDEGTISLSDLEKVCHDLVDFASFLAIEAYYRGASDAEHEGNQEHLDSTLQVLRGLALRMPLVDPGDS